MNVRRFRHVEISLFRLFACQLRFYDDEIPLVHTYRLHRFLTLEKGFALARIFHLIVKRCFLLLRTFAPIVSAHRYGARKQLH